jgi:hypothetical protein
MKNRRSNDKPRKTPKKRSLLPQDRKDSSALVAFKHLLEADLDDIKYEQEEDARAALGEHPNNLKLVSAVKLWAKAIALVCRSHAAKYGELYANGTEHDLSMGAILISISNHLRLPHDGTLLFQDWPEDNGVCDFVFEVVGPPYRLNFWRVCHKAFASQMGAKIQVCSQNCRFER